MAKFSCRRAIFRHPVTKLHNSEIIDEWHDCHTLWEGLLRYGGGAGLSLTGGLAGGINEHSC
jgi:hypothetical protein